MKAYTDLEQSKKLAEILPIGLAINLIAMIYAELLEKQGKPTHVELGQSEVTKTSDQELESKKLDADEVIAWLVASICDFEYYVKLFKRDFKL